eukprot:s13_g35.t1
MHGHSVNVFVTDSEQSTGSDWSLEEYRNAYLGRFCCHLVAGRHFATLGHESLPVGHTHEDIGLQLRWLRRRLTDSFAKSGIEFNVEYLTSIRNWTDFMAGLSTLSGVAVYIDDDRKDVLIEMADYLEANYTNYARGIEYLRKLAGQIAMRRVPPKRIEFLLLNMAGIQRGAVILGNPEIHTIHTMRVKQEVPGNAAALKVPPAKIEKDKDYSLKAALTARMEEAMGEIFNWPCVKKHVEINLQPIQQIPMASVKGFHLDLWKLSFFENAKYGETGRFPATHAFKAHFGSFLERGFESHRESLEVKFDLSKINSENSSYTVTDFTVGYVDGQNKAMIMLGIMGLLIDLDPWNQSV